MLDKLKDKSNVKLGNVFDSLNDEHSVVVHGCNCQGVMGSGVAFSVKALFPKAFYEYVKTYEESGLVLGEIVPVQVLENRWIINAMTQLNYGRDGKRYVDYDAVRMAFRQVKLFADEYEIKSINYPAIGAGLGGGDINIIMKIINEELAGLNHYLWLPAN